MMVRNCTLLVLSWCWVGCGTEPQASPTKLSANAYALQSADDARAMVQHFCGYRPDRRFPDPEHYQVYLENEAAKLLTAESLKDATAFLSEQFFGQCQYFGRVLIIKVMEELDCGVTGLGCEDLSHVSRLPVVDFELGVDFENFSDKGKSQVWNSMAYETLSLLDENWNNVQFNAPMVTYYRPLVADWLAEHPQNTLMDQAGRVRTAP